MPDYSKCLICGEACRYSASAKSTQCMFCGESFYANIICENGHYICDECQTERALEFITETCSKSRKKEAMALAFELMSNKWVKMHGQEHAYLVAAVLLTAHRNRKHPTKAVYRNFPAMLDEARKRTGRIPVNSCSYWGCSGEAIGCGVFASIVLKTSPMSEAERREANLLTSRALEQISVCGGPRCSKRDSITAILVASQFTEERWKAPLTDFEGVECIFFKGNRDCIKGDCPFFPEPE